MEEKTKGRLGHLYELAFDSGEQPPEGFREDEQLRYVLAAWQRQTKAMKGISHEGIEAACTR